MINNLVLFSSIAITITIIVIAVSALIIREIEWAMTKRPLIWKCEREGCIKTKEEDVYR